MFVIPDWKPCATTDGEGGEQIYYFSFATGESSWDRKSPNGAHAVGEERAHVSVTRASIFLLLSRVQTLATSTTSSSTRKPKSASWLLLARGVTMQSSAPERRQSSWLRCSRRAQPSLWVLVPPARFKPHPCTHQGRAVRRRAPHRTSGGRGNAALRRCRWRWFPQTPIRESHSSRSPQRRACHCTQGRRVTSEPRQPDQCWAVRHSVRVRRQQQTWTVSGWASRVFGEHTQQALLASAARSLCCGQTQRRCLFSSRR